MAVLDWTGSGCIRHDGNGLDLVWIRLDCAGLDWIWLVIAGLGWTGLD